MCLTLLSRILRYSLQGVLNRNHSLEYSVLPGLRNQATPHAQLATHNTRIKRPRGLATHNCAERPGSSRRCATARGRGERVLPLSSAISVPSARGTLPFCGMQQQQLAVPGHKDCALLCRRAPAGLPRRWRRGDVVLALDDGAREHNAQGNAGRGWLPSRARAGRAYIPGLGLPCSPVAACGRPRPRSLFSRFLVLLSRCPLAGVPFSPVFTSLFVVAQNEYVRPSYDRIFRLDQRGLVHMQLAARHAGAHARRPLHHARRQLRHRRHSQGREVRLRQPVLPDLCAVRCHAGVDGRPRRAYGRT